MNQINPHEAPEFTAAFLDRARASEALGEVSHG